jgi:hypothetical protein
VITGWPLTAATIVVQRVTPEGAIATGWPQEGLTVAGAVDSSLSPLRAVSDSAGGLYIAWGYVSSQGNGARLMHLGPDGQAVEGWPTGGKEMLPADAHYEPNLTIGIALAADGQGGAFLAWRDATPTDTTVKVLHVSSDGSIAPGWPSEGVAAHDISGTGGEVVGLLPDGAGGVIVAWYQYSTGPPISLWMNRIGPSGVVAVLASLAAASIDAGTAHLSWLVSDPNARLTIERRVDAGAWTRVADTSPDGRGFVLFDDPVPAGAASLSYRLAWFESGTRTTAGEVTLTVPHESRFALESLAPNPARDGITVRFALRSGASATLELLDIAGRRVRSEALGATGGERVIRLSGLDALPAGIYLARLSQGAERAIARVALVK